MMYINSYESNVCLVLQIHIICCSVPKGLSHLFFHPCIFEILCRNGFEIFLMSYNGVKSFLEVLSYHHRTIVFQVKLFGKSKMFHKQFDPIIQVINSRPVFPRSSQVSLGQSLSNREDRQTSTLLPAHFSRLVNHLPKQKAKS